MFRWKKGLNLPLFSEDLLRVEEVILNPGHKRFQDLPLSFSVHLLALLLLLKRIGLQID
jgi:hypothetical protein